MQRTDDILGVNRLPNENTKKLMAKKLTSLFVIGLRKAPSGLKKNRK